MSESPDVPIAPKFLRHYRDIVNFPCDVTGDVLCELYMKFHPGGSGPLSVMRYVCALIEEVAELKNIQLSIRS